MVIRREFNRGGKEEARLAKARSRRQTGRMPRSLDHLPAGKRDELAFVVELLTSSFDEERSSRWAQHLKNGQILRIILYGSYARGDWVEDPVGRYFSDYDLLVVVADEKHTDVLEFWGTAERRLLAELSSGERLRTPVNFIVHSQAEVDDALTHGRYFFMDIMADGVLLLKAPDAPAFVDPQPLAPDVALSETQAHYEDWIPSAAKALKGAKFYIDEDDTPSLSVTPDKNLWRCFGCDAGGDVIAWMMKREGVSFRHAVELLRQDYDPAAPAVARGAAPIRTSTVPKLATLTAPAEDAALLDEVVGYYHAALKQTPAALAYLEGRGLAHPELIETFRLGYADRTLGYRLPQANRKAGAEVRGRLQALGVLRDSGHEHLRGSLVVPILDADGRVTNLYGRKIGESLRKGTPDHLYLPGPHRGCSTGRRWR